MSLPAEMHQSGFEEGVAYVFGHISQDKFTEEELIKFASCLELKRQWKSDCEWHELILRNYVRMTEITYERSKRTCTQQLEKHKGNPFWENYYERALKALEDQWERIKEKGVY